MRGDAYAEGGAWQEWTGRLEAGTWHGHGWLELLIRTDPKGSRLACGTLLAGVELGVNFWDLADQYGSHAHAKEALRSLNRDEIVINTKTTAQDKQSCRDAVGRFLE